MEGVLAAFAQFDNDVRSDRTRAGMRAALELGRWVFAPPLGYLPGDRRRSEPSMILDPDRAPLVRRAFEEVASGQHTKQDVLRLVTRLGLRTRAGAEVSPQSFNQMLRKPVYAGVIDSPDFGVARKGDFEPSVSEGVFYRAQGVSRGIVPVTAPRVRNRPEFPLRNFVRCASCGKPLTGSFSTGNGGKYPYYHCRLPCRVVNIAIAKLEGAFFEELRRLQPTAGYMKLMRERVLQIWRDKQAEIRQEAVDMQAKADTIQKKLDRLDHAFIFAESIVEETYGRQRDKLREQLLLAGIDRHAVELEKLDVEGILAFAEQLLPSAANVWSQASLDQKQRLQSLFFPEAIAFDGKSFSRTNLTSSAFRYLEPVGGGNDGLVNREGVEPSTNRLRVCCSAN